jgi:putative inorganic carbon (HCO3(-)) transporter
MQMIEILSLKDYDEVWSETLTSSTVGKFWQQVKFAVAKFNLSKLSQIGSWLQFASFLLICLLVTILPAHQFVNDKETLALVVVAGLLLQIVGLILGGKEKYPKSAIDGLVFLFLCFNVISCFASHYLAPSIHGLAKVVVYTCSYFLFVAALGQSGNSGFKRILTVLGLLLASGLAVALYGLYQYKIGVAPLATWEDPSVTEQATRIYSTLDNPNLLAGYLLPMVPLSLSLTVMSASSKRWLLSLASLVLFAVFFVATVLTGSRGGYLGLFAEVASFIGIFCLWLWQAKLRSMPKARLVVFLLPAFLIGAIALAIHFVPAFEHRLTSIFVGREHTSNSFRLNVWGASWRMFLDNWWFGIGPGNKTFRLAYGLYMVSGFDALGTYCVPLEIACEVGIFGLASFFALLGALFARAHVTFWGATDFRAKAITAGVISAIIGLMTQGLFDTVFYRPQVHFIFWLLVAVLVVLSTRNAKIQGKP